MIRLFVCLTGLLLCCHAQPDIDDVQPDVTISYTLWIGSFHKHVHRIDITAPRDTTFYEVMNLAAAKNKHYEFQAENYDFGHYVTEIDSVREVPNLRYHWMIYKLPAEPNPLKPPTDEYLTPVGVDGIRIDDGQHYLFWYHKLKKWD